MRIEETERSLVLAELERRQDRLVEGMVDAIGEEIPLYRAHPDPGLMHDLRAHVRDNIATVLRVAREHRVPRPDELAFVAEMVEHRVVQGVPMDQVLPSAKPRLRQRSQRCWLGAARPATLPARCPREGTG